MRRRIGVLGLSRDSGGRVLLVPDADGVARSSWSLPGGVVQHGEHPEAALRRYYLRDVGAAVEPRRLLAVLTDIDHTGHCDWIVLDVAIGPTAGSSAAARWLVEADLTAGSLTTASARALILTDKVADAVVAGPSPSDARTGPGLTESVQASVEDDGRAAGQVFRRQRFAAYALATDPAGRVLLTRISDGYPGAGSWHLPGGGTDAGESAAAGLLRELIEETNQHGRLDVPLAISHRHQRDALGPEGVPIDWHGVRVIYRVFVDRPTEPRVIERGGSTVAAGWFDPRQALALSLTEVARQSISEHLV